MCAGARYVEGMAHDPVEPVVLVLDIPLEGQLGVPVHDVIATAQDAAGRGRVQHEDRGGFQVFQVVWPEESWTAVQRRAARLAARVRDHDLALDTYATATGVGIAAVDDAGRRHALLLPERRADATRSVREQLFGARP